MYDPILLLGLLSVFTLIFLLGVFIEWFKLSRKKYIHTRVIDVTNIVVIERNVMNEKFYRIDQVEIIYENDDETFSEIRFDTSKLKIEQKLKKRSQVKVKYNSLKDVKFII